MHPLLRPSALAVHLIVAVLVAIAGGLGVWQVGSWQEQREDEAASRTDREPVPLAEALGPDQPFPKSQVGRPVEVSGTWVPDGTVYIEERRSSEAEADGYWAVTPVAVDGEASALLVVRGWVADLDQAPAPASGPAELVGWLQPPEGSGQADQDRGDDVLPQVRIADAIQHIDQDLYGAFAVVDHSRLAARDAAAAGPAGTAGLLPVTPDQLPPVARTTGLRNLLYGIEWWVFGGFAVFLWWRWCRDEVAAARVQAQLPAADTVGM